MRLAELMDDGKPQAAAAGGALPGSVEAVERSEHLVALVLGDAGAVIEHMHHQLAAAMHAQGRTAAMPLGIVDEVREYAPEGAAGDLHLGRRLASPIYVQSVVDARRDAIQKGAELHPLGRFAGAASEAQRIGNELVHSGEIALEALDELAGHVVGISSSAKRMRVRGVRKSWEIPAKSVVRLESNSLTSRAMALTLAASVTSSRGPSSGSGAKLSAPRNDSTARAASESGRATRCTISAEAVATMTAPTKTMTMPT